MAQNEIRPGQIQEIIENSLAESKRRNAEARDRLVQKGVIQPGQELTLPASFVEALTKRKQARY